MHMSSLIGDTHTKYIGTMSGPINCDEIQSKTSFVEDSRMYANVDYFCYHGEEPQST